MLAVNHPAFDTLARAFHRAVQILDAAEQEASEREAPEEGSLDLGLDLDAARIDVHTLGRKIIAARDGGVEVKNFTVDGVTYCLPPPGVAGGVEPLESYFVPDEIEDPFDFGSDECDAEGAPILRLTIFGGPPEEAPLKTFAQEEEEARTARERRLRRQAQREAFDDGFLS